jgi:glycosyltransferase involved in cell wall biosynthesis
MVFLAWLEKTPVRIAHAHSTHHIGGVLTSAANSLALVLNRFLARAFATHTVGCSAQSADAAFGRDWRVRGKSKVIHCGIDLAPFGTPLAGATRNQLGIPETAKVIGHVGSFSVVKNHRFLIEVAANVFQSCSDAMLLLVGDGGLRSSVEEACTELGIRSRVIFTGESSRIPELMGSAMDVFVLPSLHEGLPLVLLEAQAAGLPCLASDVVSKEAMVAGDSIRFLNLSMGAKAWADAVASTLSRSMRSSDLLERMKQSDYNASVSARKIEFLYGAVKTRSRTGGLTDRSVSAHL